MDFDLEIDARELCCPLPAIRAQQALKQMAPGQILKVIATDPATHQSLRVVARMVRAELAHLHEEGRELVYFLRKL